MGFQSGAVSIGDSQRWNTRVLPGSFVLRTLSDGLARTGVALAGGGSAGRLLRLLGSVLAHPAVLITVLAALAVCGALLWWMHPRERRATGEMPDVGLLVL